MAKRDAMPTVEIIELLRKLSVLDDDSIREAVKEIGFGLVQIDEIRSLAAEVIAAYDAHATADH